MENVNHLMDMEALYKLLPKTNIVFFGDCNLLKSRRRQKKLMTPVQKRLISLVGKTNIQVIIIQVQGNVWYRREIKCINTANLPTVYFISVSGPLWNKTTRRRSGPEEVKFHPQGRNQDLKKIWTRIKEKMDINTGLDKSRFTVVHMQNTVYSCVITY